MSAPSTGRRLLAIASLVAMVAFLVIFAWGVVVLFTVPLRLVIAVLAFVGTVGGAWVGVTRRGTLAVIGWAVAAAAVVILVVNLVTGPNHGALIATQVVFLAIALVAGDRALTPSLRADRAPGRPVGAAQHPALLVNPKSGGGKAEKTGLIDEARQRGIDVTVLERGDDLVALTEAALERGADVVAMAGGDGSQALVASIISERDIPLVCIPAGTRNHFALDLGLDRDDVVGALDAFGPAVERTIDLAEVNGRVFVNNVSLGVYAEIVASPDYRDAKSQTTRDKLPELMGPDATPFDLRFTGPDGMERSTADVIQVSNNPYMMTGLKGLGSRPRLDTHHLGIVTIEVGNAAQATAFVALQAGGRPQRFAGFLEWSAPDFEVRSDAPVNTGLDGEAIELDPPLEFRIRPGALRVRVPLHAPGQSPAAGAVPSGPWAGKALLALAAGRDPAPPPER